MPDLIVRVLSSRTEVPAEHQQLLAKSAIEFTRPEKRAYHRSLEPRLDHYRQVLADAYADLCRRDPATPDTWATGIAFNIMSRGSASVADILGMTVVGRRRVSEIVKAVRPGGANTAQRPSAKVPG